MSDHSSDFSSTDLTTCDLKPIHIPGSVQPHGALLALNAQDLRIVHAGGDTMGILDMTPAMLVGAPATDVLRVDQVHRLRALINDRCTLSRPVFAFSMDNAIYGVTDVLVHMVDGLLILDFEPRRVSVVEDALALVKAMMHHVQRSASLPAFLNAVANEVRAVSGFERVMVYRFAADGSGAVVAEARGKAAYSFLDTNFPASDISQQARELYQANWVRYIPDPRYAPLPIIPPLNPSNGKPLDLSHSTLRSVSPMHRRYLANMGVVGSMSLSLLPGGQLWGLIVCHHYTPRYLSHRLREAFELFAEMTSSHLQMRLVEIDLEVQLRSLRVHEALVERMSREADLANGLIRFRPNLLDLVSASGVAVWIEGRLSAIGSTPDHAQVAALVDWLSCTVEAGVFHTDCLSAVYPPAAQFPEIASGLLALSVSRTPHDYVLWFQAEVATKLLWSGSSKKMAGLNADQESLMPHRGFAVWQNEARMHGRPWLATEIDTAHRLRLSLLEITLQRIDQAAREREERRQQQEKLTQELDRRLADLQRTAEALKQETKRRAVLEAELSQVLRRTVADQEAERRRIARELHDTLGQSLTLLQLGLNELMGTTAGSSAFLTGLTSLRTVTAGLGRDLNRLAWEIRPRELDDMGIQPAIRNLLKTWSDRSGIAFDLHLRLNDERLSADIETTLYRVMQEALTNVVRHADATRVGVMLNSSDQQVMMIIEDDGHGFFSDNTDLGNLPPKRLGLLGIRERVGLVGGSLEIESSPDRGATVFVRIPLAWR